MIPRAFRLLLPCPTAHATQQQPTAEPAPSAPARRSTTSEHELLTAGTADLWRELAAMAAGDTP